MRDRIQRISTVFACAVLLGMPGPAFSGPGGADPLDRDTAVAQCAARIEQWFALTTVPTQELDLDRAKIVTIEGFQVFIPLKKPHGPVKAVHWRRKEMSEALDMLRLLRQGKVGSLNLLPFLVDPADMYEMRRDFIAELKGCQNKEQVQEVLGQCTECLVREWLDVKP